MSTLTVNPEVIEPIKRLTRDLATAAVTLSKMEARYLVDAYYAMQHNRIAANNQIRALSETEEPHTVIQWLADQDTTLENQIKRALDKWTDGFHMGEWSKSVTGIGPVIAAGLAAHIDITKAPTVGHIWRFAGLDPTLKWEKGQKRPFNASLKTLLAFKLGESFVKVQANENDIYGKYFRQRKDIEMRKNENLDFAETAKTVLETKKISKSTDAYKFYSVGKLPPAHIHARARRWAVKLFVAHYHAEAYFTEYGKEPPLPYPIALMGHSEQHFIERPKLQ